MYTKYVYGNGLIGEETCSELSCEFKTYHFDYRGSTIAITDSQGNVTDRFKYNTYGKVIEHTGNSDVIFKYNGRDGVVTEPNGLYYMRARYYSPDLMRFINADILAGSISDTLTLNRYAYANCNPVSNIDPFGLCVDERGVLGEIFQFTKDDLMNFVDEGFMKDLSDGVDFSVGKIKFVKKGDYLIIKGSAEYLEAAEITQRRIKYSNLKNYPNILKYMDGKAIFSNAFPVISGTAKSIKAGKNLLKASDYLGVVGDIVSVSAETYIETMEYDSLEDKAIIAGYNIATTAVSAVASTSVQAAITTAFTAGGSALFPGFGTLLGLGLGMAAGWAVDKVFDWVQDKYVDEILENN